ncbi:response regulator [Longitalea luteola]|uniref:response regulator n=1 Tax=Longitalea luteola TaxID=2812563 RepID=UPI001A9736E4|nr:response regulator [Longitalea luteola]
MNKTVLIVDDSDFVVQMLRFTLEQEGYTILAGIDGRDALKHFDGQPIDLMITDLHMPVVDGLELIRWVRLNAAYQDMPIVLFDSNNTHDAAYLERSGATALLSKDKMGETLISTVKYIIG